ncbi:MAG: SurA N-terminal domain-containing protein [Puniceicoccales bacterium]|jgi:peptidyl-prolyl cis-trans isomerase D|nr:SurA N-terminal domain-containing protein [Puniceicoccales bacterium]
MISFLQRVLQKHHKWLFSILLVIVTISFVFTVGSSPGIGRNTRGQGKKIFGYDLSSQKNVTQLLQEVELSAQLQQIFIGAEQFQNYALLSRLAILKLANDLAIPKPNKDSLNHFIETYSAFAGKNHQFDANRYNKFLEQLSKDPSQVGIFERTITNDFKIAIVEKLLSGQGFCLDTQAKSAIVMEMTKYSFLTAKFDSSLAANELEYSEDELQQYFETHKNAYKIGEQIVLDYIEFPWESFLENVPEASPSDLQQIYNAQKNQFQDLAEGSDELKIALSKVYEHNMADRLAMEAADQFICDLYERDVEYNSEQLKRLIEKRALKMSTFDPLVLGQFSENEYFSSEPLARASKLNEDRYYSDPVRAKNGNPCVLLYRDFIPSIYPSLDSVRERVIQDFLAWKKEENFSHQVDEIQKVLDETQHMTPKMFTEIVTNKKGTITKFDGEGLSNLDISSKEKETLLSLRSGSISETIFTGKMEAEIIFLEKREMPLTIDPVVFEQTVAALEKQSKKSFNNYIIEMILDEMDIKNNREETAQQFQAIASLIRMQRYRDEFGF